MLTYDNWLLEFHKSTPNSNFEHQIDYIKNTLQKYFNDKIYTVQDFESFVREGEPLQQKVLFAGKSFSSFNANFTESGKLFSVDFFKPDHIGPFMSMYVKKGTLEQVTNLLPTLLEDPRPLKKEEVAKISVGSLQEKINEEKKKPEVEVEFQKPPVPESLPKPSEEQYEYGNPEILFKDLDRYIQMIIEKKQPSLVITGSPGVGKTFMVTKQLKEAGVDFTHIKGRSTPAGLYTALYENKDKIVVVDDCDSVFKNEDAVNILKGALDSYDKREISWLVAKPLISSSGQKIPTKFIFNGGIIFISNLSQKKIDYAIKSRSFVLEVSLSPEDMIKRMEEELPNIEKEIPMAVRKTAMRMIVSNYKSAKHLELSMRTLIKAIKIVEEVDNLDDASRLILQQCSYR